MALPLGLAACVAIAALSLLIPSTVSYDPYAWAGWAREIVHGTLDTPGGPAWKPLPVLVDLPFAPFGSLALWTWLVVARAGGLVSVLLAYRLGARLAGRPAGLMAAVAVVLSTSWLFYLMAVGLSEPLLAGLALLAVERHFDGHRRQVATLIYACVLMRPELLPFFVGYGALMWRSDGRARPWLVAAVAAIPAFFFLPDYLGSGDWMRSAHRAAEPTEGGPLLTGHPAAAVLQSSASALIVPALVGAGLGAWFGLRAWWRDRSEGAAVGLIALAAVTLVWEALLTEAHKSAGDQRYLIIGYCLAAVISGVGWVRAVDWASARIDRRLLTAAVVVAWAPFVWAEVSGWPGSTKGMYYQDHKTGQLPGVIAGAGGRARILSCGPIYADTYQGAALAWALDVPISRITVVPPPPAGMDGTETRGTEFRTSTFGDTWAIPFPPISGAYRVVATSSEWQVVSSCSR